MSTWKKSRSTEDTYIKIPMRFEISLLNMMIGYLFKKSVQITRRSLLNMKKLFDILDDTIYEGNIKVEARISFIRNVLEARLVNGFENDDIIINYCRSDNDDKETEEIINSIPIYIKINYEEIKFINKTVEDRLNYSFLFLYKNKIYDTLEKMDAGNFKYYSEINDELNDVCTKLINHSRQTKTVEDTHTFSLDEETFENSVTDIVNMLKNPSRVLRTGIKKLNEMLSPGFIGGRTYVFLGLPGFL